MREINELELIELKLFIVVIRAIKSSEISVKWSKDMSKNCYKDMINNKVDCSFDKMMSGLSGKEIEYVGKLLSNEKLFSGYRDKYKINIMEKNLSYDNQGDELYSIYNEEDEKIVKRILLCDHYGERYETIVECLDALRISIGSCCDYEYNCDQCSLEYNNDEDCVNYIDVEGGSLNELRISGENIEKIINIEMRSELKVFLLDSIVEHVSVLL